MRKIDFNDSLYEIFSGTLNKILDILNLFEDTEVLIEEVKVMQDFMTEIQNTEEIPSKLVLPPKNSDQKISLKDHLVKEGFSEKEALRLSQLTSVSKNSLDSYTKEGSIKPVLG